MQGMKRVLKACRTLAMATAVSGFASCMEAGLNQNEREAGDGDDGVDVGFGEIAIDPTGSYLLSANAQGRLLYAAIAEGNGHVLGSLKNVYRVVFGHDQKSLFLTSLNDDAGDQGKIVRYDLETEKIAWSRDSKIFSYFEDGRGSRPWLDVTRDDRLLIVTRGTSVDVFDAASGKKVFSTGSFERRILDVDLTPDQKRLIVTLEHEFSGELPSTSLETYEIETWVHVSIKVPNCSSELVLSKDGRSAFLAPSSCQRDPVSVIDLQENEWVRNLPGFGPVALSPSGELAVAFIDMDNLDESLFLEGDEVPKGDDEYHLMLIDTRTLRFQTVPLGDQLPRYAISPDGKMLLVDGPDLWTDGRIRILDVATKKLAAVKGPGVQLGNFVMKSDSSEAFLLDEGLYRLSLDERTVQGEPIDFTPWAINLTPDDATLVLREDARKLRLYSTADGEIVRTIDLGAFADVEIDVDVDVDIDIGSD
jgi:DNA-binding beta-propeller fold protein YncE